MTINNPLSIKNHPNYEETIEEVIHNNIDKELMKKLSIKTKREERAEALYVLYKLRDNYIGNL